MEERERKAMDKTLYVSDLDGTLLTPREDLSPFTIRVLNRLESRGWPSPMPRPAPSIRRTW